MIIIICNIHLKADNNSICLYDIKMAYRKFYCFTSPSLVVIVVVFVDVNPNSEISPPLLDSIPSGKPVVTKSIPRPIEDSPIPPGAPMLNSQIFLPVSLSSAIIIPDGFKGVFTGAPSSLNGYGFPVAAICPEKTNPLVTTGDKAGGNGWIYPFYFTYIYIDSSNC